MTPFIKSVRMLVWGGRAVRGYVLATLPQYWRLRRTWSHALFSVWKRVYAARQGVNDRLEAGALLGQIGMAVLWPALGAVVVVVGLGFAERLLSQRLPVVGAWLTAYAPDSALYAALAGTVVQTVGAFLGLYLAALSVVVTTSYANVPADVRSLLITEPASGVFLKALAFTTAAGIVTLAVQAVGWGPGTGNFWVLVSLSLVSVFGVVHLGLGVLSLFDPAVHTHRLARSVWKVARAATTHGFRNRDPSFQANYQREAERALTTFQRLMEVAVAQGSAGRSSLIQTATTALAMLHLYLDVKPDVPHESQWFKRVRRHPSWFRASHSTVEMAERTGMLLQPEIEADEFWLETHAISMTVRGGAVLADRADCEGIAQLAHAVERVVEALAANFRFEDALRVQRAFVPLAKRAARLPATTDGAVGNSSALYQLGAVDALFRNITGILVASGQAVAAVSPERIQQLVARVLQRPGYHVAGSALPRAVNRELETVQRCLTFERAVEGRILTPAWFVAHAIGAGYAQSINELLTMLLDEAELVFAREGQALAGEKHSSVAVLVAQIGLEWCDKLEFHLGRIARARAGLSTLERAEAVQAWPGMDEESAAKRAVLLRDRLLQVVARAATALPSGAPSGELPDLFGYAYVTLARECYMALADSNVELFRSLFPSFFSLSLRAYARVGEELHGFPQETQLTMSADVLAELVEVSGYALIWTELDGGDVWQVVRDAWDAYLNSLPDARKAAEFVMVMLDFRQTTFRISTSDLRRTAWHQDFERRMRERGLYTGMFGDGQLLRAEPVSPLARAFIRHGVVSRYAAEAFLVEYLLKRPEASGFTPTRQMNQWTDAVEIERRRVREGRPPRRGILGH